MIRVYVRGRERPFDFPNGTKAVKEQGRVRIFDARPSDANPYSSRSPHYGVELAFFADGMVDAVILECSEED